MSIKFRYFCQQVFSFFYYVIAFIVTFFAFTMQTVHGAEKEDIIQYQPRYYYQSYYAIFLGNVPIGTAIASTDNKKTNIPNETIVRIASRMGVSPVTSTFYVESKSAKTQLTATEPYSIIQKTISYSDKSTANSSELLKENIISENNEKFTTNLKNLFFKPEGELLLGNTLTPFPKDFFTFQEDFDASYAGNGLLKNATFILNSDIKIEIKSISKNEYFKLIKKLEYTRLDIGLIASFEDEMDEVDRLAKTLGLCQAEMTYLNNSILKKMPYESYLMYRRIINLNKFCHTLGESISASNNDDINEIALLTQQHVLNFMREDALEIPHAVSDFSERTLYYNQNMMFLWPRITTYMIQNSIKEMKTFFNLDLNRKSLLGIQLRIKSLQPRSVVRADITQVSSPVDFEIETSSQKKFFLDGTIFANNPDYNLGSICKKNAGHIGLDLTDSKNLLINSVGIRGVWDTPTKLTAARAFAISAISESTCEKVHFKVDPTIIPYLNRELNVLKKESLSQENSLLLSNYRSKKLWIMPGKYRITISSVKNEKVISVQEFTVGAKTQTNVIANVQ